MLVPAARPRVRHAARARHGQLSTPVLQVQESKLLTLPSRSAARFGPAPSSGHDELATAGSEDVRERALFMALPAAAILTTTDGRVLSFNGPAEAAFGRLTRFYGGQIGEVLPFVDAPRPPANGQPTWRGRVEDANGRSLDVEVSRTTLAEGLLPDRHLYIAHDVSQHAELNRLREHLLYCVAHELSGPLGVLENALELLATGYAAMSVHECDMLVGSAQRMSKRVRLLMEDLLNAGSIQSGRFVVRPRPTAMSAILEDAVEMVRPMLQASRHRVEPHLPAEPLMVLADPRYVRHVLSNLLTNAAKYSPHATAVRVRVEGEARAVRVTVEDRGAGIPVEQQTGLFERFYRARPDGDTPGVGLGLAIAKGIVDAHGGAMGLDSAPGKGTRIWFTLPRPTRSAPSGGRSASRRSRRRQGESGGVDTQQPGPREERRTCRTKTAPWATSALEGMTHAHWLVGNSGADSGTRDQPWPRSCWLTTTETWSNCSPSRSHARASR